MTTYTIMAFPLSLTVTQKKNPTKITCQQGWHSSDPVDEVSAIMTHTTLVYILANHPIFHYDSTTRHHYIPGESSSIWNDMGCREGTTIEGGGGEVLRVG